MAFTIASLLFLLLSVIALAWTTSQIRAVWRVHGEACASLLLDIGLEALLLLTPFIIYIAFGIATGDPLHSSQSPELPMASFLFASIAVLRVVRQQNKHANERSEHFGVFCAGVGILFAALSVVAIAVEVLLPQGDSFTRSVFNIALVLIAIQYFVLVLTMFGMSGLAAER